MNINNKVLILFYSKKNPMQSVGVNQLIAIIKNDDENCDDSSYSYDLMSWNGSKNMLKQVQLHFDSLNDAELYAKKYGYKFKVIQKDEVFYDTEKKSYLEKFR